MWCLIPTFGALIQNRCIDKAGRNQYKFPLTIYGVAVGGGYHRVQIAPVMEGNVKKLHREPQISLRVLRSVLPATRFKLEE
jgi:hypothetical protein